MIEIWFSSREEVEGVAEDLSDFGRPERLERTKTIHEETEYLTLAYEEALEKLEELSESMVDGNPARRLAEALSITRSLFESGDHEKLLAYEARWEAEKRLYEVVDELEDLKDLRERIERSLKEALEAARGKEEQEIEFREEISDYFEEYSFLKSFLVDPILNSVLEYENEDDPLEAFTRDVHLDVTPISDRFDHVEKRIDLDASVIHGLKLDVEHVLRFEEVMECLEGRGSVNPPEEIYYGFLTLQMIVDEILSTVRGKKKARYDEFVDEVVERVNTTVHGGEAEKVFPHTTRETVESIVKKLKRAGYVRKKGNKISEV